MLELDALLVRRCALQEEIEGSESSALSDP